MKKGRDPRRTTLRAARIMLEDALRYMGPLRGIHANECRNDIRLAIARIDSALGGDTRSIERQRYDRAKEIAQRFN